MDVGSVAASALQGSPAAVQSQVGTAVLKMAMETVTQGGDSLIKMMEQSAMEQSVMPHLGQNLDVRV